MVFSPAPKNVGRLDADARLAAKVQRVLERKRQRKGLKRGGFLTRTTKLRPFGKAKVRRLAEYAAYLRSPEWKALRKVVFERDGYACRDCGESAGWFKKGTRDIRGLECDHLHYRTWMRESPSDLQTLCRPCHQKKHAGQWWKRIPAWAMKGAA